MSQPRGESSLAENDVSYPVFLAHLAVLCFWWSLLWLAVQGAQVGPRAAFSPANVIDRAGLWIDAVFVLSPLMYFSWLRRDDAAFARNFPRLHKRFGKRKRTPDYPLFRPMKDGEEDGWLS